jgi:DNA polymerase IV
MKILCVLLPHFPLRCEVCRNPALAGCTAIVTSTAGSQKLVLDYSPDLEGLQAGMPLQQALARQENVRLLSADLPHYWSVFDEILDSLEQKSPLVEGSDLGQVYIGIEGLQLIYRTDHDLIAAVKEVIRDTFQPRMGIAGGKFPSYLAALYSSPGCCKVLNGDLSAFLKELPCDILPISLRSKDKLRDFGMRTLGQVSALPPGPLQSQFGPEGKRIRELALGYDPAPLYPRLMEEVIEENITLSSVTVSLEAILVSVESLLAKVFARIGPRGLGLSRLTLWTRSLDSGYWEQNVRFKEPAMDIKSAVARLKPVLQDNPQTGPVEQAGIRIGRNGLGRRHGRQVNLFSEVRAQDHLLEDIKQLELRLGGPQIFKIKEVEPWSRIPERRYALTPLNR